MEAHLKGKFRNNEVVDYGGSSLRGRVEGSPLDEFFMNTLSNSFPRFFRGCGWGKKYDKDSFSVIICNYWYVS